MNKESSTTAKGNKKLSAAFTARFEDWKSINNELISTVSGLDEKALFTMFATAININQWPALKKSRVEDNRTWFSTHYKDLNNNASFYDRLIIVLQDLIDKVTLLNKTATGEIEIPFNDLALRFIHRYDTSTHKWFLTVQLCSFGTGSIGTMNEEIYNLFDLTMTAKYFNITHNGIADYVNGLSGTIDYHYADDYFTNVKLDGTLVSPTNDQNTKSVTMAWNVFLELYNDNKSLISPNTPDKFKIIFESGTHEFTVGYDSPIPFPHCVLVYLSDLSGNEFLANGNFSVGDFKNKAANLNSICPLRCKELAFPVGFIPR